MGTGLGSVVAVTAPLGPTQAGARAAYSECASVTGVDASGQSITLGSCSGPTGGSGELPAPLASPATITWAGGGTTTVSFTARMSGKSKCPTGSAHVQLSGHATASTGPAAGIGGMFYAGLCVAADNQVSLVPGKAVLLQDRPA